MGDCGCGGGGAATTTVPHTQTRTGQRPSCPVEECGCDTCVRIRIVEYLPWLSASDIAVGAHIPGGAMVIPELPEREPDLTPPWMWLWWEDGGGVAREGSREGHASSEKAKNPDTGETTGGASGYGTDEEEEDSTAGSTYGEWKAHKMGGGRTEEVETTSGKGRNRYDTPCLGQPVTVDMWNIALLGGVCQIDFGPCPHLSTLQSGTPLSLNFTLPAGYKPTRTKKEMREFCIPEWEAARALSWSGAARVIEIGPTHRVGGLYWSEGAGFYHHALMYAVATLHGSAELVEEPTVFASKCGLAEVGATLLRSNIEDAAFRIVTGDLIKDIGCAVATGTITINTNTTTHGAGSVSILLDAGSKRAFTILNVIRLCDAKAMNAALADYYFWWAWRLYSYGVDVGDFKALVLAQLATKAALSEICEIAALLLHEYTHYLAGSYEDHEGEDPTNCCHHGLDHAYRHRLLATYGCPMPMVYLSIDATVGNIVTRSDGTEPAGRFDYSSSDGWSFAVSAPADAADSCLPFLLEAAHCEFWSAGHAVDVGWTFLLPRYWDATAGGASIDSEAFGGACAGRNR